MEKTSQTMRVRLHLICELRGGLRAPGDAISVPDVARETRMSHTPVREALERLAGEGMVIARDDRKGFTVPLYSGTALADLYAFDGMLIEAVARQAAGHPAPANLGIGDMQDPVSAVERTISIVTSRCQNRPLLAALSRTSNLLAPYRRFEPGIVKDWGGGLVRLHQALLSEQNSVQAVRSFVRQRVLIAPMIADGFERAPGPTNIKEI